MRVPTGLVSVPNSVNPEPSLWMAGVWLCLGFIMNVRAAAASALYQVVDLGHSLSNALPAAQQQIRPRDHALLQEICYGVLRQLPRLESISQALMGKPLKANNAYSTS